jgi:nucleotide sugar dehydrogenase
VVQGLGFVGGAMAAALARGRRPDGSPRFAVIGLDLDDAPGRQKVAAVRAGEPPIKATDPMLTAAYLEARATGNLTATTNPAAISLADVIVMDVGYDVLRAPREVAHYKVAEMGFAAALRSVAERVREDALVVVETTVPPGTTKRLVAPTIAEGLRSRGLDPARVQIAHSYERVMPGPNYLASITDFHRVFAGLDAASAIRARAFLEGFINTRDFPLTELDSPTASETAKVLENSFRATNIALIQEWSEYAQAAEIDLWRVIQAIRVRPTHRNIMAPGFGVGGYCLTKDSLLADWGARQMMGNDFRLSMALRGTEINDAMPLHTFELLRGLLPDLAGRRVVVLGVSYLADVADTRSSPTAIFRAACQAAGASVLVHDPLVTFWPEAGIMINTRLESLGDGGADALVLAVRHQKYLTLNAAGILRLFPHLAAVVDGNDVLSDATAGGLAKAGVRVAGVGKGHWRQLNGAAG